MQTRQIALGLACVSVLLLAGCGGSNTGGTVATRSTTAAKATPARGFASGGFASSVSSVSAPAGVAGVPSAALPGITVLGTGEQGAKPDRALIRLTIGSLTEGIGPSGPSFATVDQADIDPAVAALKSAGAENIAVDPFGQGGLYSLVTGAATVISFESKDPDGVDKLIDAARAALRTEKEKTRYTIQSAVVEFAFSNCDDVEQKAWQTAFADAHDRAAKLATLAGAQLGDVLAVSEATFTPSVYSPGTTGCQSLIPQSTQIVSSQAVENSPKLVQIGVTLQVTYALAPR